MQAIIHGIILAFGLILPLVVQNVFVFSQGATQPYLYKALPAAITAAISDTLLILLAAFGLSLLVLQFAWLRFVLMMIGIIFLLYMGGMIWKSEGTTTNENKALSFRQQILFALSVSLLNPHAILDIVGVIGTSAITYSGLDQVLFTVACISVSWAWFLGLIVAGNQIKNLF